MKKQLLIAGTAVLLLALGLSGCEELLQTEKQEPETGFEWFQTGNTGSITQLQLEKSEELEYNRIGFGSCLIADIHTLQDVDYLIDQDTNLGLKWMRLSIDWFDWAEVKDTGEHSEYYVDSNYDEYVTRLADNDIKILYILLFWDGEIGDKMGEEGYSRFKTEDEIQHYLDYVQFIVHHFKDRVEYYEILNEPESPIAPEQVDVEPSDYINLVKRTIPVIREEHPEAKIVAGATSDLNYLFDILDPDIMPLVDAISWHPMYGTSPECEQLPDYYYNYPSIVQEIKEISSAHGFEGEYIAEELNWRTSLNPNPVEPCLYSETVAAKYYARGIIIHLGMDITTGVCELGASEWSRKVVQGLSTLLAGAQSTSLLIEIQGEATNIKSYSFSLSNGDKLIALWTDGIAVDNDPGVKANLTVQGITSEDVTGIDVLNGYQQSITTSSENGNLIIQNLMVRDYPLILRITESS